MRRFILAILVLLLGGVGLGSSMSPFQPGGRDPGQQAVDPIESQRAEMTLTEIDPALGKIRGFGPGLGLLTFFTTRETQVRIGGASATLADLRLGDTVTVVYYAPEDQHPFARIISRDGR